MATFTAPTALRLTDASLSGHTDNPLVSGTLSWTGHETTSFSGTVTDNQTPGALDRNDDAFLSAKFTGYYVTIGGQNFAVFNIGGFWLIPYDPAQLDISDPALFPDTNGSTTNFSVALDTAANCFLTGTRIATPAGDRPIEALQPGDTVLTAAGKKERILWVWRQDITNIFGLGERRAPIRIAANALGPGMPRRDLVVTADHALVIDGLLVNAGALTNGSAIRSVPLSRMPARFSYWHVETERHEVIIAENCPTESFIDYSSRPKFDNYVAYMALYGRERAIPEMALPRITSARLLLPHLRRRLGVGRAA